MSLLRYRLENRLLLLWSREYTSVVQFHSRIFRQQFSADIVGFYRGYGFCSDYAGGDCNGRDRMVVGFTTISAYHH